MAVRITGVEARSPAMRHGIRPGEYLISINGHPVRDVLDFRFYETEPELTVCVADAAGIQRQVHLRKPRYSFLGLEFETYLMDKQRRCRNNCMFCFIDQMPPGMRESLYFKDDDNRLSFLFGNYITLTNLSQEEVDRIVEMHISPINISVHTTNPELRVKMMGNRFAGKSLDFLYQLAERGTELNGQLVLCPGVNDGDELRRTLRDLKALYPSMQSIAAVPVGLTRYRENLPHIDPYTKETAGEVIDIIEAFAAQCREEFGVGLCYASDEFYLLAERPLPEEDYYDGYVQLDNGVGSITLLRTQVRELLAGMETLELDAPRKISLISGEAAAPVLRELVAEAKAKCPMLDCTVYAIRNDFFGPQINVAGLITGGDVLNQLQGQDLGDALLMPAVMLRHEGDLMLDDVSLCALEEKLGVSVTVVGGEGADLLEALFGTNDF
jgi:putative radical SAM enzyme (TIGR03279 family)